MSRTCLVIGLLICGWLVGAARADTYKLTNGQELSGEILPTSASDAGVQVKTGEGTFEQVPWASFSQEDLQKFIRINKKLAGFVEPFIEVNPQEKLKKTEVKLQPPPRLQQPPKHSLLGALVSSGLGFFTLLLIYSANIYAAYEIAIFRAQSIPLVCGVSAALPVAGPIIFLSMPTKMPPSEPAVEVAPEGEEGAVAGPAAEAKPGDALNPMAADGAAHPAGLKLAHTEEEDKASQTPSTTFQRGQFTFNRRFFETKFSGFFGVVRRDAEKDMVLVIKSARGEYTGQRISRIAANDLHLEVHRGAASEEIMIPFQEIQQIILKHKNAK